MFRATFGFCLALIAAPVWALGPHEVLLLINGESADSVEVGEAYAAMRQIPVGNVVRVAVPDKAMPEDTITTEDFERLIWAPATRHVHAQGLDGQILAWVYSVDFPVRINTQPEISVLGLTFSRNKPPKPEAVETGTYVSPLFAGPTGARGQPHLPQSFDVYAEWLGGEMPLPAMMLGYTRPPHGNSVAKVLACLRGGVGSDGTAPTGTVYFVQTGDVRSRCRAWQQGGAVDDLKALGVRAVITNAEPVGVRDVLGMQVGEQYVNPLRNAFVPGSMGEHLTSASAILHNDFQTKLTAWIEGGATASAGAIAEPYAVWAKFPSACFYFFQASGSTMIESFYQAVRCPLQLLLLGDPLASPWKPVGKLVMDEFGGSLTNALRPRIQSHSGFDYGTFRYYLDGKQIHEGATFTLSPVSLAAGTHRLRVVGYRSGLMRQQVFEERTFDVPFGAE